MKDKILCAIRSNILKTKCKYDDYRMYFVDKQEFIEIVKRDEYKKTIVVTHHKTWWGKSYEKERTSSTKVRENHFACAYGKEYEISKQEYDSLFSFRNKEIERKQKSHINSLCK